MLQGCAATSYLKCDALYHEILQVLRGVFDGLFLGVLSDRTLSMVDAEYYSREAPYVDETYNRSGLLRWESSALDRHFGDARKIIVTSAGGGREVLALADAGREVVGFEPHPGLARFARGLRDRSGEALDVRTCPRDAWPGDAPCAEGIVVGWGGYMLLGDRLQRIGFLREAADHVPTGAPILLSFFVRTGRAKRYRIAARIANALRRPRGRRRTELGDALSPNRVHFFSRHEVALELAESGFEMVDFGVDDYGWAVGRKLL